MKFTIDENGIVSFFIDNEVFVCFDLGTGRYSSTMYENLFNSRKITETFLNDIFEIDPQICCSFIQYSFNNFSFNSGNFYTIQKAPELAERLFKVAMQNLCVGYKKNLLYGVCGLVRMVQDNMFSEKEIISWINSDGFKGGRFFGSWFSMSDKISDFLILKKAKTFFPNFDRLSNEERTDIILAANACKVRAYPERWPWIVSYIRSGVCSYLKELFEGGSYTPSKHFRKYLKNCEVLNIEPSFTGNFLKKYAQTSKAAREKIENNRRAAFAASQLQKGVNWHCNGFMAVIPTTLEELQKEGEQQHNCVGRGGYYESIADNEDNEGMIIFIRKEDNPEESYLTIEVDDDGEIEQCLAAYNEEPDPEGATLAEALQEYLYSIW